MAVISNSTFDPLRDFVNTRLAQGVPIVDADWNELDDIRKFEVRAYLKWFVGNGIPEGNNGFEIDGSGALSNDFWIRAGAPPAPGGTDNVIIGLSYVGRCVVDGLDVTIASDIQFSGQPLHVSQAGSAALAARLGVPQIQALQTPTADGTFCVYLDVWERLVTPAEMPSLILPGLGTESCSRMKREWVIRVRAGKVAPIATDADYITGHSYYAVAFINRRNGDPAVNQGDVHDTREQRLLMLPSYLTEDVLGTKSINYRLGLGRPVVSLRDAINALLHGDLLANPDTPLAPTGALDTMSRGFLFDNSNGVVAIWQSERAGGTDQIFAARLDRSNIAAGFGAPQQITTGGAHAQPHAAMAPNGDIIVTYQSGIAPPNDVFYRRGQFGSLGAAAEVQIATGASETHPHVVVTGNIATFFYRLDTTKHWQFRRRQLNPDQWIDAVPLSLSLTVAPTDDFYAAAAADGNIWAAFTASPPGIQLQRLNPGTAVIDQQVVRASGSGGDFSPFVLPLQSAKVQVFWASSNAPYGLWTTTWDPMTLAWSASSQVPGSTLWFFPSAVQDDRQGIWIFYTLASVPPVSLYYIRIDATGGITPPRQVAALGDNDLPFVVFDSTAALWLFWASDRTGTTNLYFRRIVTTV